MSNLLTKEQIEDLLVNVLGVDKLGQWKGDKISFCCPIHGEQHPSCGVNSYYVPDGSTDVIQAFNCFACGAHGSLIKLLTLSESDRFKTPLVAVKFLEKRYGVSFVSHDKNRKPVRVVRRYGEDSDLFRYRREVKPKVQLALYKSGKETYKYFFNRGFTRSEMREYRVGRDLKMKAVTIPVFWEDGSFVGVQKKLISAKDFGKRFYYDFQKSKVIYPLDKLEVIDNTIIGVESMEDVIRMRRWGIKNVVSFFGAKMSREQAEIICDKCGVFIALYDSDNSGRVAIQRARSLLKGKVRFLVCQYPDEEFGKDPGEWGEKLTKQVLKTAGKFKILRI